MIAGRSAGLVELTPNMLTTNPPSIFLWSAHQPNAAGSLDLWTAVRRTEHPGQQKGCPKLKLKNSVERGFSGKSALSIEIPWDNECQVGKRAQIATVSACRVFGP